ncbi:FAD-binding protein [Microbispora amethystogenes]|uniref:FAD-binding oxidoreductase n=1 Tax=Microbispora amethystogenes TaxID=1427754 RepID=UPI0033D5A6E3
MEGLGRRAFLTGATVGGAAALTSAAGVPAVARPAKAAPSADGCERPFGPVVIGPGDPRYDSLLLSHNRRFRGRPQSVQVVGSAEQVAEAVGRAVAAGRRIAVRSGGHCLENFTASPEVETLIDLSPMSGVTYDERRRAFAVGAGATLGQVYKALFTGWGVTIPAGSCPSVGVGGHITGGGYGFLSRRYGLAADHLYAVEVVVVDASGRARVVVATRDAGDPERDLWWAHTGGGGGNFGVVTRFWLRSPDGSPGADGTDPARLLPKAPAAMRRRIVMWPWESMDEKTFSRLLRNYCDWYEANSAPNSPYAALWGVLLASHRSAGQLGFIVGGDAGVAGVESLMAAHAKAVTAGIGIEPASDTLELLPYLDEANWVNEPAGRSKNKAADLRKGFTDRQIAAVYRHLSREDYTNPGANLSLTGYGGRINAVASDATATATRDAILRAYFTTGGWASPDDDARHIGWMREFYRDVYSDSGGVPVDGPVNAGSYINYADADLADPKWNTSGVSWETLYYKGNYPRLQKIKKRYDPLDVFRHALSVRLPK